MSATLSFARYGQGIGDAAAVLRNNAAAAGLDAPVPTCPGWSVLDLVVHQGVVHRWAAATLTGSPGFDEPAVEREGRTAGDVLDWLDEGMVELLNVLATAPADLDVPFFLADAPEARLGWARRQCHETTMHAIDAMAARLGRPAHPDELWFSADFAADGVDELLHGFVPRPKTRLRWTHPASVAVRCAEPARSWTIGVGPDAAPTVGEGGPVELTLTGSARGLYLALWNRGGDVEVSGEAALWATYRELMRVVWH